jgi:hypothetical protein
MMWLEVRQGQHMQEQEVLIHLRASKQEGVVVFPALGITDKVVHHDGR